ncbi:MAG: TetR family transcriptional regulator [Gammaproteobacteria bacterium]
MARTRSSDYDAQRDRILSEAVRSFAETGYASASMSALAAACGTSKARLYHYYPSKEAILFDSLDRYTARLEEIVEQERARALSPREALRALLRAFLAEYEHSRAWHVALLNDTKFLDESHRERIRVRERHIVEAFADTLGLAYPGRMRHDQRIPLTMALLGMINFTFAWLKPDGPMSYAQFAELVIELWENGLAGRPEPTAPLQCGEEAPR